MNEVSILNYVPAVSAPTKGGVSDVSEYVRYVNSLPFLTEQEEETLCDEFYNKGNKEAGTKLVLSHLRLVVKFAFIYKKYTNSVADLISEGNVGLLKACRKFSVDKSVRFATYATFWIRSSMQEFVLRTKSIVRFGTTNTQKKVLFNLGKAKRSLDIEGDIISANDSQKLADALDVDIDQFDEIMKGLKPNKSLDEMFSSESSDDMYSVLEDESSLSIKKDDAIINIKKSKAINALHEAILNLDERTADVIRSRRLKESPDTLADLAKKYGVSVERIRQIEEVGLQKLQDMMASGQV